MGQIQRPDYSFQGQVPTAAIIQAYQQKAMAEEQSRQQAAQAKEQRLVDIASMVNAGAGMITQFTEQAKKQQMNDAYQAMSSLMGKKDTVNPATGATYGESPDYDATLKAYAMRADPEAAKKAQFDQLFANQNLAGEMGPQLGLGQNATMDQAKLALDLQKFKMEQSKTEAKPVPQSGAQKAVDREFAKEYTKYVAAGGYADTMQQIDTLSGVKEELIKGKKNLTGPVISAMPDSVRSRIKPDSMAAQQAVEQSVQRTLKATLGGQFTEREGVMFMKRGFDPALDEKENAKKLTRAINQLKVMAIAKQKAVDYYEENGTLTGFRGELYTLKDGAMVKATKEDFFKMMGAEQAPEEAGVPQIGQTWNGMKVTGVRRIK